MEARIFEQLIEDPVSLRFLFVPVGSIVSFSWEIVGVEEEGSMILGTIGELD